MSDLYNQIVSKQSGLERIIAKIPGFRGYKEMSARREADRMIRDHVVKLINDQMTRLIGVEKKLMSSGGLAAVGKTRSAKTNFQTFIDRINTAAPGYSGFYSAKKIGPDELEKIYSFDAALIDYVDHFSKAIDAVNTAIDSKGNLDEAITGLETLAQEANSAYAMRDNVLTEIY
jgi:hypothetical protein